MKNDTPCYDLIAEQTNCFACNTKLKKAVQCEFCAMKYCADCRLRSRAFPQSITLSNGEKIMGKICKICDRKFLMLDQYQRQVMPMHSRDADLAHLVESYEMKLRKAEFLKNEEDRLMEELCQKRSDFRLEKHRIMTSAALHEAAIKRGEAMLEDIEREAQMQMLEIQKDRIKLDDADVDLEYLQSELISYKERQKKAQEEEKRR